MSTFSLYIRGSADSEKLAPAWGDHTALAVWPWRAKKEPSGDRSGQHLGGGRQESEEFKVTLSFLECGLHKILS